MNKRNIIGVLMFLVILVAGDRICGGLIERLFMKSGFRYSMLYKGELQADIVVLGNSRGLHMFHPPAIEKVTGQDVANLSFNALPAVAMPVVWEDYLEKHEPPKLLILEVSCAGAPEEKGSLERFSVLIDQNPKYSDLIHNKNPTFYYAAKLSRIFRYNSSLMWRSGMFLKRSDQGWIMNSELNEESMNQVVNSSDTTLLRSEENAKALRHVIETAEARGVEVKLVMAPYLPAYYDRLPQPEKWLKWIESELDRPVINQKGILTDASSFSDHLHLNEAGALKFAERLQAGDFFSTDSR